MASEEPYFDTSLKKKKKKKAVAFSEDPLGADADPTTPAPPIDDGTPTTVHEQMKQNGALKEDVGEADDANEEDELKAMFGDLKKKKKKKEIPVDLGEDGSGASTPVQSEAMGDLDFSDMKKKKKKKSTLDLGEEGSGTSTPVTKDADGPIAGDDMDFSDLKKKKKTSKKKAALDLEAFEREVEDTGKDDDIPGGEHLDALENEDLGEDVFDRGENRPGAAEGRDAWLGSDRDYTYPELLSRFYQLLHAQNPQLLGSSGKAYRIPPPNMQRDGNKKSVFVNIGDICKKMKRSPEHVIQYMYAEMGTTGSVDGQGRLVIKGRFQQKQMENILRKYISEYVTCKTCKSPDTLLDKKDRIFFVVCESCNSRISVSTIKSGYQAQIGRRKKVDK